MKHPISTALASAACLLVLAGCERAPQVAADAAQKETPDAFVERINADMAALSREVNAAGFTQATFITPDTEYLNAKAYERYLEYFSGAVDESKRYENQQLSPKTARAIALLKLDVSAPAPKDAKKRAELTQLLTRLDAMYGSGKYCPEGPASCKDLTQLEDVISESRNYDALVEAWKGWHSVAAEMRDEYQRFVELANEGARELGFADLGAMWRSNYDMPPEDFDKEATRLYSQVEPLYKELHCYARGKLAARYGEEKVPAGNPIPVPLLGNMWAQQWNKIYDDILKPYPRASIESADRELQRQKWDAVRMARSAESFYASIGFPQLPGTFWERSMLVKPRDREVLCHASAWDMEVSGEDDVRIKMCTKPTEEDLMTIYHELGHVYYYLWYRDLPYLFQDGAHDGFHEAVGDAVNLSVTPAYLNRIGLVSPVKPSPEAIINQQMKMAVDKIAFLPFGKLIDEWRWRVFSGEVKPESYNTAWWELRRKYQGVAPPVERTERDFDPGAKYHIPGNTPYTRYFLSFILQFQFHKALCDAAGHKGPLHECSIFDNRQAGRRFGEMLALGQSQPWPDTFEKLTGTRQMDASAIIDYFQPLMGWLKQQNEGKQCGWGEG
ncbi:MAG: M2 family metallopeptidase [Gammaproteobacteria bacterium]